ncbi:MAG: type I-PGING CRISPR-associated protein Cas5p [Bacteroidetes bacterium SW_11_45_7]|nr:MAG: type I-PGING CRISPR-associated protein Cas5p [Bacteroidetes bacterium SW_11_45_7]
MNDTKAMLDLSVLKEKPNLDTKVLLEILPLAPLSMVSDLPGSYYKTLKSPNKKMLCGLFENIMRWHIDIEDRKKLINELKKVRKKQGIDFNAINSGSTYQPLLFEFFEIELPVIPTITHYDDYWKRAYRRNDSHKHSFGTPNIDSQFLHTWNKTKKTVKNDTKRKSKQKNKLLDWLFKRYIGKFPIYYSSPTKREYIAIDGTFKISIMMDKRIFKKVKADLKKNNNCYLGNSEGWVHIKIEEI